MLDEPHDMRSVVRRAFEKYAGDDDKIEDELIKQASVDNDLAHEFLVMGVKQAMRTYYSMARSLFRGQYRREPMSEEERDSRVAAAIDRRKFWEVYALFGHMTLRDATALDLRESAEKRKQMANTNLRRARFELALADRMGDTKKTVGEFFKSSVVRRLAEDHHAI